jgi:hypothetical protein
VAEVKVTWTPTYEERKQKEKKAEGYFFQENTETLFSWQGPPVFTIAGLHKFHMEPANDGASTVFTQTEDLKGLLAFIMSPSLLGKKMAAHFDIFHRDLKARAEQA